MRALMALAAAALVIASCLVDRRSGDYACATDDDCAHFGDNRVCDPAAKVCVPKPPETCPVQCNAGCSLQGKTCNVSCTQNQCGSAFTCPAGFTCTVMCSGTHACDDIDCSRSSSCTVSCTGTHACGDVTCSDGRCQIACIGANACGKVDCSDACACSAACQNGSCDQATCPAGCDQGSGCGGCDTCSN